jgi:hypothetical protein
MLDRARSDVLRELSHAGLLTERIARVQVVRPLVHLGRRVGSYEMGGAGVISVPALTLGRFWEYARRTTWTALRDVLRHEYAHALADHHPDVVKHAEFRKCFGGGYHQENPAGHHDAASHASEYAASSPSEDFAETVMMYLKRGGDLDGFQSRPIVRAKLNFVARIARRLNAPTKTASRTRGPRSLALRRSTSGS